MLLKLIKLGELMGHPSWRDQDNDTCLKFAEQGYLCSGGGGCDATGFLKDKYVIGSWGHGVSIMGVTRRGF